MRDHEIAILGGGIGGLTVALALARLGIDAPVYEANAPDGVMGGGLMVAHNGMQVMQQLGMREAVEGVGYSIQRLRLTDERLALVRDIAFSKLDLHYGLGHTAIRRSRLQRALLEALPAGVVRYGMRCEAVENHSSQVEMRFAGGESVRTQILIAADGMHSVTRRLLAPEHRPRFCGQAAWTGIRRGAVQPELAQAIEAWGPGGTRMVVTPVGVDETYWVVVSDAAVGAGVPLHEVQARLDAHYHPVLAALPRETGNGGTYQWFFHDMARMAPWHVGRVVFLGDAAHATTPNLGQGANQAMEDALLLAGLLARHRGTCGDAFAEYYRCRRAKARQVVDTSRTWGQIAHWRNPWLRAIRNFAVRSAPESVSARLSMQLAAIEQPV